jgi:hypothetical protein
MSQVFMSVLRRAGRGVLATSWNLKQLEEQAVRDRSVARACSLSVVRREPSHVDGDAAGHCLQ